MTSERPMRGRRVHSRYDGLSDAADAMSAFSTTESRSGLNRPPAPPRTTRTTRITTMGVEGLSDLFKLVIGRLSAERIGEIIHEITSLAQIPNCTLILDSSPMMFKWNLIGAGPDPSMNVANTPEERDLIVERMNTGCLRGFARFLGAARSLGITPIVVFDLPREDVEPYGTISRCIDWIASERAAPTTAVSEESPAPAPAPPTAPAPAPTPSVAWLPTWFDIRGVDAATLLQAKTGTRASRIGTRAAAEERTHVVQFSVQRSLVSAVHDLCAYFDVQTVFPITEADWAIAALAKERSALGPTYILSIDSDMFTYDVGSAKLLRSVSLVPGRRLRGSDLEMIDPIALWDELGLSDIESRAMLAATLGCDYYIGVNKLGPKTAPTIFSPCDLTRRIKRLPWREITQWTCGTIGSSGVRASGASPADPVGLAKWNMHPSCFDGMSADEITRTVPTPVTLTRPTFRPSLRSVDRFLTETYAEKLSRESHLEFQHAVLSMMYGPLVEGLAMSRPMLVGGGVGTGDTTGDTKLTRQRVCADAILRTTGPWLGTALDDLRAIGFPLDGLTAAPPRSAVDAEEDGDEEEIGEVDEGPMNDPPTTPTAAPPGAQPQTV